MDYIQRVVGVDQNLAIVAKDKILFLDRDNHLISTISKQGKGPGEYIHLGNVNTSIDGSFEVKALPFYQLI